MSSKPDNNNDVTTDKAMIMVAGNVFGLFGDIRDHKIEDAMVAGKPLDGSISQEQAEAAMYQNPQYKNALLWKDDKGSWKVMTAGIKPSLPAKAGQEEHAINACRNEFPGFQDQAYLNGMLKQYCKHLDGHLRAENSGNSQLGNSMDTIARLQASESLSSQQEATFRSAAQRALPAITNDPFVPEAIPGTSVHLGFACAPMCNETGFGQATKIAQETLTPQEFNTRITSTYQALQRKAQEKGINDSNIVPTKVGGDLYAGTDELKAAASAAFEGKFSRPPSPDIATDVNTLAQDPRFVRNTLTRQEQVARMGDLIAKTANLETKAPSSSKKAGELRESEVTGKVQDSAGQQEERASPPTFTGNLHQSSQTALGHATVVSTNGSDLNRFTYEFLQRKTGYEALRDNAEYKGLVERYAESEKQKQELAKRKEATEGKEDPTLDAELKQFQEQRKALQEDHKAFLENYFKENKLELNDEEKRELHQHLNDSINKAYPNRIAPAKNEQGVDVFKNDTGEFHSKTREDGKYELSTNNTAFTGVVRVPRVDAKGNELKDCDIIEYSNGKPVSVVAGREGQSNIHDFDKVLQASKGKGVVVSSQEATEDMAQGVSRFQSPPRQPHERQDVGHRSVPVFSSPPMAPRQPVGFQSAPTLRVAPSGSTSQQEAPRRGGAASMPLASLQAGMTSSALSGGQQRMDGGAQPHLSSSSTSSMFPRARDDSDVDRSARTFGNRVVARNRVEIRRGMFSSFSPQGGRGGPQQQRSQNASVTRR